MRRNSLSSAKEYWDDEVDEVVEEVGIIMSSLGDKRILDKSHKKNLVILFG